MNRTNMGLISAQRSRARVFGHFSDVRDAGVLRLPFVLKSVKKLPDIEGTKANLDAHSAKKER